MFGWFKKKDQTTRGRIAGEQFIASNPSRQEILDNWSAACSDQEFDRDGGKYAKAWKDVVRPLYMKTVETL